MSRIIKLIAGLSTVAAIVAVFLPALWSVSHSQALASVLFGQFAAMSIGHTTYRITSGKRPSLRSAAVAVICGGALAVSPIVFELVTGFTTMTMVCGGLVVAVGLYGIGVNLTSEEEKRIPDLTTDQLHEESAKAA